MPRSWMRWRRCIAVGSQVEVSRTQALVAIYRCVELIDLIPNAMSFRIVTTIEVDDEAQIPANFTGRVRRSAGGSLVYVGWFHDGLLHNPGRLHPAYRRLRANGNIKYDLHYSHGKLQDPAATLPAVRGYYAGGALHYEERYTAGLRCDGADGTAALIKWREDGTLRHELRYRNGQRIR